MAAEIKILLVENIHNVAKQKLVDDGFSVTTLTYAPSEDELIRILPDYQVLGLRSKTEVTEKVLRANPHLLAIGCFCIGTNQVNLKVAQELGIPVFNAPHSNTRSVAELVICEMVALSRQLGDKSSKAHLGDWVKSADGAKEVRGKTLGIVGYGHIGSQVSILAEAMGLKVIFYDVIKKLPLGNAYAAGSLDELLSVSDFVSLHVPETKQTKQMITQEQLSKMKKGSFLINASRGTVIVIEDLVVALKEKHLAGCAIDVFPVEPASNKEKFVSPLQGLSNVILTPHIGGSTEEAQYSIGLEVSESFRRFLKVGSSLGAVNFPQVDLPMKEDTARIFNIHKNEPGVLGQINGLISAAGLNVEGQSLSTSEKIGYLLIDLSGGSVTALADHIQALPRSLRTKILF
ncbi:MAG: phosphoglycerate dehydrogenase [Pseudobdellovibrionaceae bacterium]